MLIVDNNVVWFALLVIIVGSPALAIKLMIFALAVDDWWELRAADKRDPERMVADDEVLASALRVISVLGVMVTGLVWLLVAIGVVPVLWVRIAFAVNLLLQAVLADVQGVRAMTFRRSMARIMSRVRRPVARSEAGGCM